MTRTHALTMLLQHGPLTFPELREITGWTSKRLVRGLEVACGPRGPVRHEGTPRGYVYRLTTLDEVMASPPPKRRGPKGPWSPARRAAHRMARVAA